MRPPKLRARVSATNQKSLLEVENIESIKIAAPQRNVTRRRYRARISALSKAKAEDADMADRMSALSAVLSVRVGGAARKANCKRKFGEA